MEKNHKLSPISDLIGFKNEEDKFEFQKEILSLKFIQVIEKFLIQNKISKKELAKEMNYSASYISQVFCAHKLVNMDFLVKAQNALNMPFEVKLGDYKKTPMETVYNARHNAITNEEKYHKYYPDYSDNNQTEQLEEA